ncbi:MAG: dihydroorotate dehydrogenase electron transfer subunit [Coriobacteriales bacterium]|nr:dihydroorotate dehydrogenase electron transfer subunit [Coriobacteriales bacterium]
MGAQVNEHRFEVISCEAVAEDVFRLVCRTPVAAELAAGQFVNLHVPADASHILRIPLSFSRADALSQELEFVFAVVGEGTARLSHMRPGDASCLTGPCGKGWALPGRDGRALLVAGGMGLAPVVACAHMLDAAGVSFDVIVGAQSASKHVSYLNEELRGLVDKSGELIITTDDGSLGIRGFTTAAMQDMLAEHAYACVYSCGPQPMMAGVARIARERAFACQVSLERMMGCGFGACSCCNVELVSGGYALCCADGPVFDAEEVVW